MSKRAQRIRRKQRKIDSRRCYRCSSPELLPIGQQVCDVCKDKHREWMAAYQRRKRGSLPFDIANKGRPSIKHKLQEAAFAELDRLIENV